MTFVDTNVFMYSVGRLDPLRDPTREFFKAFARDRTPLCTSAKVVQEMLHAYVPAGRLQALDAALALLAGSGVDVSVLEYEDVTLARQLNGTYPGLGARDLCHWRAAADAA